MKYLIQNKHWNIVEDYNIDKLLYLLIDRSDVIRRWGNRFWINNKDQEHREYDLPAVVFYDGEIKWFINSVYVRSVNEQ